MPLVLALSVKNVLFHSFVSTTLASVTVVEFSTSRQWRSASVSLLVHARLNGLLQTFSFLDNFLLCESLQEGSIHIVVGRLVLYILCITGLYLAYPTPFIVLQV